MLWVFWFFLSAGSIVDNFLNVSLFFKTSFFNPAERTLGLTDADDLFLHKIICLWRTINSEHSVADSFRLYFNFDQKPQYISSRLYEKLLSGSVRPNARILAFCNICYKYLCSEHAKFICEQCLCDDQ